MAVLPVLVLRNGETAFHCSIVLRIVVRREETDDFADAPLGLFLERVFGRIETGGLWSAAIAFLQKAR